MTIPEAVAHVHRFVLEDTLFPALADFVVAIDRAIGRHDRMFAACVLSGAREMNRGRFLKTLQDYWQNHARPEPKAEWREVADHSTWGPESYIVEIFPRGAEVALLISPLGGTPQKFRFTARCGARLRVEERVTTEETGQ